MGGAFGKGVGMVFGTNGVLRRFGWCIGGVAGACLIAAFWVLLLPPAYGQDVDGGAGLSDAGDPSQAGEVARNWLTTEAEHAVIMDYETGIVLFSKNADRAMPPASMSKIMTALVVFDLIKAGQLSLEDTFTVSDDAWRRGSFASGSSTMCLEPGEVVSVENLLRGVIILSGNDAAITLAQNIAGSEPAFALMMEAKAAELGLQSASFANATGWPDPGQMISARDLAQIARVTMREHPQLFAMYGEPTFDFCTEAPSNRYNRNPLLGRMEGVDGMKTGRTRESGFGLVATRNWQGERRIIVFNGLATARGRARVAEALMTAAYEAFFIADVITAGTKVGVANVYGGVEETVVGEVRETVIWGYHTDEIADIRAVFEYEDPLLAPIAQGERIGTLVITAPGRNEERLDVFASTEIPRLGHWARMRNAAEFVVSGEVE